MVIGNALFNERDHVTRFSASILIKKPHLCLIWGSTPTPYTCWSHLRTGEGSTPHLLDSLTGSPEGRRGPPRCDASWWRHSRWLSWRSPGSSPAAGRRASSCRGARTWSESGFKAELGTRVIIRVMRQWALSRKLKSWSVSGHKTKKICPEFWTRFGVKMDESLWECRLDAYELVRISLRTISWSVKKFMTRQAKRRGAVKRWTKRWFGCQMTKHDVIRKQDMSDNN